MRGHIAILAVPGYDYTYMCLWPHVCPVAIAILISRYTVLDYCNIAISISTRVRMAMHTLVHMYYNTTIAG